LFSERETCLVSNCLLHLGSITACVLAFKSDAFTSFHHSSFRAVRVGTTFWEL